MQLTSGRLAPRRAARTVGHPVAALTALFVGGLVALNAQGFAVPATAEGGHVVGLNEGVDIDNTRGDDGDCQVEVTRACYALNNSDKAAITRAHIGQVAYVEDDNTVASVGTSIAGAIVDITSEGVWVDVGLYPIHVTASE